MTRPAPADPADPDVALLLSGYAAFARGDIDAAVAGLAEDVVWVEPDEFLDGGRYVGREAVAGYLANSRATWRELRSTATPYRVGGDIVVVHELSGELADGAESAAAVADVCTVRGGQVVAMTAYADPEAPFAGAP